MNWVGIKLGIDRPAVALLVGLPLTAGLLLGANQTRAGAFMPWAGSIGYWITISCATWWMIAAATNILSRVLRPWHPPPVLVWTSGAVAGSFVARPLIYTIAALYRPLMFQPELRAMRPVTFDLGFLAYYLTNWSLVIAMWVLACAVAARWRAVDPTRVPSRDERRTPIVAVSGFLRRLPVEIGCNVLALQAEDHYVRVYTDLGNALVLGSLADAIYDLAASGVEGQRTHRSWWISRDAVVTCSRRGRHQFLTLRNGIEVPVSITYRESAAIAGLTA